MARRAPPGGSAAAGGGCEGYQLPFFSIFQKTVTGATIMPLTFFRTAAGWYHCPSQTCVGYCVSRTCTASAMALSLAGLVSWAYWSRSDSISLSHGQPNSALSRDALM